MSRKLTALLVVACIVVAVVVWVRADSRAPLTAQGSLRSAGAESVSARSPGNLAEPPPALPASELQHERAKVAMQQMEELAQSHPPPRAITADRSPRPGESEEASAMRLRALADYDRFVTMAGVPPDRDQALRRLFVDAEDNWKLALKSANRSEPDSRTNIMVDPVLAPILQTLESDFRRDVRTTTSANEAMMLQSLVPSVLPFLKTKAFVAK